VHGIPRFAVHGYWPLVASLAFGVVGGSAIGCTVMLGTLSGRFGRRPVLATIYAGRVLIFSGFFLIRDNPVAILIVAVLAGIPMAGPGRLTSPLTAESWGRSWGAPVPGVCCLLPRPAAATSSSLAAAPSETPA